MIEVLRKSGPPDDSPCLVFADSLERYVEWAYAHDDIRRTFNGRFKYVNSTDPGKAMLGVRAFFYGIADPISGTTRRVLEYKELTGTIRQLGVG